MRSRFFYVRSLTQLNMQNHHQLKTVFDICMIFRLLRQSLLGRASCRSLWNKKDVRNHLWDLINFMEPCEVINFSNHCAWHENFNRISFQRLKNLRFYQRMDRCVWYSKSAGYLHYRVLRTCFFFFLRFFLFQMIVNWNYSKIIRYLLLLTTDLVHRAKECSIKNCFLIIYVDSNTHIGAVNITIEWIKWRYASPCSTWNRKTNRLSWNRYQADFD